MISFKRRTTLGLTLALASLRDLAYRTEVRFQSVVCVNCAHIRVYHRDAGCGRFACAMAQDGGVRGIAGWMLDAAWQGYERWSTRETRRRFERIIKTRSC
jgi:hypothetical protein